jgi:hypothetical protein
MYSLRLGFLNAGGTFGYIITSPRKIRKKIKPLRLYQNIPRPGNDKPGAS